MDGMGQELRRLGLQASRVNGEMAKAIRDDRKVEAVAAPVVSRTVVCRDTAEEKRLQERLAVIATAYRNGLIDEAKATAMVMAIDGKE